MRQDDIYPSRVGGESFVMPRKDPVVHADPDTAPEGILSRAQLDLYESHGYLAFEELFSRDVIGRLQQRAYALRHELATSTRPEIVREPEGREIRSIFAVHESDSVFADLVHDSRLRATAEYILGGPVYVHQSRINYKPGFVGKEFYWHSDFETWHVEDGMPRMRAFSLSLNLTENRAQNGPLMVIPGSHHHYVCCPGWTPARNYEKSLRRQEVGVPPDGILTRMAEKGGIQTPTGPPGSAILFDCNLMHGSNGNITPFPRTNLFLVFNSVENELVEPFSGQPARPEHIGSRRIQPLQ